MFKQTLEKSFFLFPLLPHPARSTGALVPDLLQSRTVRPLLSGIKFFRQLQVSCILNPAVTALVLLCMKILKLDILLHLKVSRCYSVLHDLI